MFLAANYTAGFVPVPEYRLFLGLLVTLAFAAPTSSLC
jgi:hypothetical protein